VIGDQVPDTRLVDQPVGIKSVGAHLAVAAVPVAKAQPAVGEDGFLGGGQVCLRAVRPAAPPDRVDEDAPAGQVRLRPVRGGQGRHHLSQRRAERLPQAQVGVGAAGQQDEQRAGLVSGQAGDVGAESGQQRDAAVRAAHGVDGHAGRG